MKLGFEPVPLVSKASSFHIFGPTKVTDSLAQHLGHLLFKHLRHQYDRFVHNVAHGLRTIATMNC